MAFEDEQGKNVSENDGSYTSILKEHNIGQAQREKRIELLKQLSKPEFNDKKRPNAVIAHLSEGVLDAADIQALVNMLLKIGEVEVLNIILHSPGGDGTVVEKLFESEHELLAAGKLSIES